MWLTSFEAMSRVPPRPVIVRRNGELPPMSVSRPGTDSPLLRMTVGREPGIFAQSASLIEPPKSMTATSFCGICRSAPLTLTVKPTPLRSISSPLTLSPERMVMVALSCARAIAGTVRATTDSARIVRLNIVPSCVLPTKNTWARLNG
jgi:hypothetical protein